MNQLPWRGACDRPTTPRAKIEPGGPLRRPITCRGRATPPRGQGESRGRAAPPHRPVRGEVGPGVCPGSGCLPLTAADKVAAAKAAAGREQDGAAARSWVWRRRGRGSRRGGRRGRQVGVKDRAGTPWPPRGRRGALSGYGGFLQLRFFSSELGCRRRVIPQGPRTKGACGARVPDACVPGSFGDAGRLGSSGERARAQCGRGEKMRVLLGWGGRGKSGTPTPLLVLAALKRPGSSLSLGFLDLPDMLEGGL